MNIYKRVISIFFSTAIIILLGFVFLTSQQQAIVVGGPGSGGGGNLPPPDVCTNASCGAGTYCGGDCGVTGSHDNLYSCVGTCTGPGTKSNCHKSTVTYCGPNKCQPQIVGGDICAGGSSSTGAPNACQNNGGNCLTANSNGACPNNGATLAYTCTSGTICCSQGGDQGAGGNGGGNISAGVQCGSTSGSCANQSCNPNGPGFCEDNTNTCIGTTKQIKVYTCQYIDRTTGYAWTFAYNQTGGSKCYTNACIAPSSGNNSNSLTLQDYIKLRARLQELSGLPSQNKLQSNLNISQHIGVIPQSSYIASANMNVHVLGTQQYKLPFSLTYDPTQKLFINNSVDISTVPSGTYDLYLHVDKFLDMQLLKTDGLRSFALSGSSGAIDTDITTLVPGDIAPSPHGDNVIDIQDYNTMITCLQNPNQGNCLGLADLNLDGKVDNQDLQILLSHFGSIGASPTIPGFTCVSDPACKKMNNSSIQLCPLKCTKTTVNQ